MEQTNSQKGQSNNPAYMFAAEHLLTYREVSCVELLESLAVAKTSTRALEFSRACVDKGVSPVAMMRTGWSVNPQFAQTKYF
jgi:hypothetical protein